MSLREGHPQAASQSSALPLHTQKGIQAVLEEPLMSTQHFGLGEEACQSWAPGTLSPAALEDFLPLPGLLSPVQGGRLVLLVSKLLPSVWELGPECSPSPLSLGVA